MIYPQKRFVCFDFNPQEGFIYFDLDDNSKEEFVLILVNILRKDLFSS